MSTVNQSTLSKSVSSSTHGPMLSAISDPYAPSLVPKEKITLGIEWVKKPSSVGVYYDLGKIGMFTRLINSIRGTGELTDPEIHVIWTSYCPAETYQNMMSISLEFNKSPDPEKRLLYKHQSPMHLPAHHIFKPRQTISLSATATIPWSIGFDIEEFAVDKDFHIGKLQIFFRGYASGGTGYTKGGDSELILMAPVSEITDGATRISRPRTFGEDWNIGGYKIGSLRTKDVTIIQLLQKQGVDVEGLMMIRKLDKILSKLSNITAQNSERKEVIETALKVVDQVIRGS
ncbi:TPA_asm: protein 3 [Streptoglossa virus 1]|uniref:Protein 3 n=1 Tax=Streptoglossa virus 1 TaxID=2977992 RepID=A0A9N7AAN4_9RHAB|nr:TPA_asm: protein 3 [Streptoglossa virus 1]